MRYKLLVCVFILLIATPVLAQEFSPIVIKTGKPIPSVVKSGEPFKITYRVNFLNTVIVYEEQMKPGNLALEKVEVIDLEVVKYPPEDNDTLGIVNVWDFIYTFRIIQPQKGVYKIPSFNFIWVEKKAGATVEETKDKEKPREMPTEEVGVGYVSSVVKPPPLDIRDEISFVSHVFSPFAFRLAAQVVIGISSLLVMVIVFRFARFSKNRRSQEVDRESNTETAEDVVDNMEPILSPKQARKKFLKELKKLQGENMLDLTKKIRFIVRLLLLAELRGTIRDSMSENEIYTKLSGLDDKQKKQVGSKYSVMLDLVRRLKGYQEDIDSGRCSLNPVKEIAELRTAVSDLNLYLKLYRRVSAFVKRLVRRVLSFVKRLAGVRR